MTTGQIVGIVIAAVVLVVAIVLCIRFREKIKKFLRVYKSELKKVVWLPWNQTKKSTLVVLVVMVAFAVVISLLDWGLGEGFLAFVDLFN
jgi:preprotein translocase SecE subunit